MDGDLHHSAWSSPGVRARYGRACVECSQSKTKCIVSRSDGHCERCHRLNKDCRPSVTVRRRNPKTGSVSKTARLEQKLEGLVTLLQAGHKVDGMPEDIVLSSGTHVAAQSSGNRADDSRTSLDEQGSPVNVIESTRPSLTTVVPASLAAGEASTMSESPRFSASGISPLDAEEYLTLFRIHKSMYFPFVHIPLYTTAQELRQERPFLWLCLMTVASNSTHQQQVLGGEVRDIVAQEMVLKNGLNLDILLGLLAYISWSNYQVNSKPCLSVYVQLAMSIVHELGLNKPLRKDEQQIFCVNIHEHPKSPTVRTMEERRAVLGCFLLSSIISSFLQRIDALRWTSHLEESLQILQDRKECLNDEILVQQVRLQLIVEKVALATRNESPSDSVGSVGPRLSFYLRAFHTQLQVAKSSLAPYLQGNEVLLAHYHSTELAINEMALSRTPIADDIPNLDKLNGLLGCVESIKSWFNVFLAIDRAAYIGFPFSIFSQLMHCLITLYKLSTFDDPAWDKNGVRKTASILTILDQVINNLEQVAGAAGLDNTASVEGDVFSRTAKLLRSIRPGWDAQLQKDHVEVSNIPSVNDAGQMTLLEPFAVDFTDNEWLTDFLAPNY